MIKTLKMLLLVIVLGMNGVAVRTVIDHERQNARIQEQMLNELRQNVQIQEQTLNELRELEERVYRLDAQQPSFVFRQFPSVGHFKAWYEINQRWLPPPNTCVDYAAMLQLLAYRDGYLLSTALVANGKYYFTQVAPGDWAGHKGILLDIGGDSYYVEPAPQWFRVIKVTP